jgi:stage V sporulation protein D (sporulation-specific penicillin-binding protein)
VHEAHGKNWDGLTMSRMSYGHAMMVTPLQMCMAVASIANGGKLMRPQIIKEVRDDSGNVVQQFLPEEVRRVCSTKTATQMKQAMIGVVADEKGTGHLAAIPDIVVAGKTGTSQLYSSTGGVHKNHYCVSFAGFAPADNPQLAAIIVVDDPQGEPGELMGGKLAAPIFAKLMKQSLHTMAVANAGSSAQGPLLKGGQR